MRRLALFFVTTCAASAAFAQVPPPAMPPGMTPAETVSTAPAAPVKKIIKLGLDGRNGKGVAATAEEVAKMTGDIKESASAPGMPAPPAAMVAAPAAAEETPKLRSDKKIRSDASIIREKREAAAKAKAEAAKAKAPAAPVAPADGGAPPAMPTM